MGRVKVSISFDDGRSDNYDFFKSYLNDKRIPATLFIATGFIDGLCDVDSKKKTFPMTISQIKSINECGIFEIASHSKMHSNNLDDIAKGKNELLMWLGKPLTSSIGFASPGSVISEQFVREHKQVLSELGLAYIRTGSNFQGQLGACHSPKERLRSIGRVLYTKYKSPIFYYWAYGNSYVNYNNLHLYTSFPVFNHTSPVCLKKIIDNGVKRGDDSIFMFHSIGHDVSANDTWCYEYSNMVSFCEYLCELRENDRIEIVTMSQLNVTQS